jgi:hypothetical protein
MPAVLSRHPVREELLPSPIQDMQSATGMAMIRVQELIPTALAEDRDEPVAFILLNHIRYRRWQCSHRCCGISHSLCPRAPILAPTRYTVSSDLKRRTTLIYHVSRSCLAASRKCGWPSRSWQIRFGQYLRWILTYSGKDEEYALLKNPQLQALSTIPFGGSADSAVLHA